MAAGQVGDLGPMFDRQVEHLIGQATAGMDRGQQGTRGDLSLFNFSFDIADTVFERFLIYTPVLRSFLNVLFTMYIPFDKFFSPSAAKLMAV